MVPISVPGMSRLSREELRVRTLRRQFPATSGTGPADVLKVFTRLGPIQSQVPRSPFLTAATRLPGVRYETVRDLFEVHRLLRSSSLRGTVHTTVDSQFPDVDAVSRQSRLLPLEAALRGSGVAPSALIQEVERFTGDGWRLRADVVAQLRGWLAAGSPGHDLPASTFGDSLIWGHSGLLRRPRDQRWETRTDVLHRRAASVRPELAAGDPDVALDRLVGIHLGAYGPASRRDVAFFLGCPLGRVDAAVQRLGDAVVVLAGPEGEPLLDLAEPSETGANDPGLRLLPEFDGLLLGYHGGGRTRFVTPDGLAGIWAKVNGIFSPTVLYDSRLVATWRTVSSGRRTDLEVSMLAPGRPPPDEAFTPAVEATRLALGLRIGDVRVLRSG